MAHPKRRVFFSFHYQEDAWRAAQIRNARTIEGNEPVSDNNWEQVKRGGERAIRRWIDMQLETRSCLVVLVGAHTAERKWVNYEIQQAWKLGKGLVGVRIDRLKDRTGQQNRPGSHPFIKHTIPTYTGSSISLARAAKLYLPTATDSQAAYSTIVNNLETYVEEAIAIRAKYP